MKKCLIKNQNLVVEKRIYKKTKEADLTLKIYKPENWTKKDKRSSIIFFFGGGWVGGNIDHFEKQSRYLSSLGMVSITPEYRVKSKHSTPPVACVKDAKSAVSWVYQHSKELGIDKNRIAVGGGSSGGHIAACTVLLEKIGIKKTNKDINVNSIPGALVLFNPPLNTTKSGCGYERIEKKAKDLSPIHHLSKDVPPTIIFHGKNDNKVPFNNSEDFCKKMKENNNQCILVPYEEKGHGFFNYEMEKDHSSFFDTLKKTRNFLESIGYL